MAAGYSFNAAAAACLFLASLAILSDESAFLLIVVVAAILASILFLLGWLLTVLALLAMREEIDVSRRRHARGMAVAFSALTVGFAAGLLTLPWVYPESYGVLVTWWSFLFVPSVYAFAVLGYAAMSILGARIVTHREATAEMNMGGIVLIIVVAAALADQVLYGIRIGQLSITMAGVGVGHGLAMMGWLAGHRREARLAASKTP